MPSNKKTLALKRKLNEFSRTAKKTTIAAPKFIQYAQQAQQQANQQQSNQPYYQNQCGCSVSAGGCVTCGGCNGCGGCGGYGGGCGGGCIVGNICGGSGCGGCGNNGCGGCGNNGCGGCGLNNACAGGYGAGLMSTIYYDDLGFPVIQSIPNPTINSCTTCPYPYYNAYGGIPSPTILGNRPLLAPTINYPSTLLSSPAFIAPAAMVPSPFIPPPLLRRFY